MTRLSFDQALACADYQQSQLAGAAVAQPLHPSAADPSAANAVDDEALELATELQSSDMLQVDEIDLEPQIAPKSAEAAADAVAPARVPHFDVYFWPLWRHGMPAAIKIWGPAHE